MNLLVVKDGTLKLTLPGTLPTEVDCECQITEMTVQVTPTLKTATTVCSVAQVPGISTYVLHLVGVQDYTDTGISTFLWENEGALVDFVMVPSAAADPSVTGKCFLVAGNFGGVAGEIAVFTADCPCEGKPVVTPAVAVP